MIGSSRYRQYKVGAALAAAILAGLAPLAGQDFFEIVDVPLVEVDVLVTDGQGRPALDLSREAFSLLVDGEEQEIAFFVGPRRTDSDGALEARSLPAHLAILFDNSRVERQVRNLVIDDFREVLREDPSDLQQIMVATVGLEGLGIQQEFTDDPEKIDAALERVAATVASDVHLFEYESLLTEIQKLAGARDPTLRDSTSQTATLVSRIIAFSERSRSDSRKIASQIFQLADGLDGLPGQRSILYIGGAVSVSSGEALLTALKGVLDRSGDGWAKRASAQVPAGIGSGGGREIDSLAEAASLRGVALYSYVVGGGAQVLATGSSASSITAKDSSTMDSSGSWSPGFDSRTRSESRSALEKLAAATGGSVYAMTGGSGPALKRFQNQMESRYLLGFHPPGGADGQSHDVEVGVGTARLRVHHRRSFRARGWDEETSARLRSTSGFGRDENRHGVELRAELQQRQPDGSLHIPLTVRFPLAALAIEPVGDTHRAQVSLFTTAFGGKRFETTPVHKRVLPVVLPNDDLLGAMGQMAEHRIDLEIPENARGLAIALRDDLSTELSIVSLPLPGNQPVQPEPLVGGVPEEANTEMESIPVRLVSAALLLSGQQGGGLRLEAAESAFRAWGHPGRIGLVLVAPPDRPSLDGWNLEIHAYLLDAAGNPVSRSSRRFKVDAPLLGSILEVPVESLEAGRTLGVLVRDLHSNEFGLIRIPVAGDAPDAVAGRSSASVLEFRIAAAETPGPNVPESLDVASKTDAPSERRRWSVDRVALGLLEVLELTAAGEFREARIKLRDLEIEATSGQSPLAIVDLGKKEAKSLMTLAENSWERLLPLALLWAELIEDYRQLRLGPLSEHAITMSTQLASKMARKAESPGSRVEAANLLVSLSGFLLYSQRLARTEELLQLAVKVDPNNTPAALALVATREQQGNFTGAIDGLDRLLGRRPKCREGLLRLAVNLSRTGHETRARETLRSLWEDGESDWIAKVAVQELARLLSSSQQPDEAVLILETAIERWPEEPGIRVQLAWIRDRQGNMEEAADRVSRIARGGSTAEGSPRFRYHRWYHEGLEGVREELAGRSRERAQELVEAAVARSPSRGTG